MLCSHAASSPAQLPNLESSYITYVNNFALSGTLVDRLRQQPAFQSMEAAAQGAGTQRLDSLLIMPVQRLPRYALLLKVCGCVWLCVCDVDVDMCCVCLYVCVARCVWLSLVYSLRIHS